MQMYVYSIIRILNAAAYTSVRVYKPVYIGQREVRLKAST